MLALESVFPPIPSETVLPLTGYLVSQGRMSFIGAVIASTVGAVVGALILYWVGYVLGKDRTRALVKRYGRWMLLTEEGWFVWRRLGSHRGGPAEDHLAQR